MDIVTKTPAEIADLKVQWAQDPCWDIADTEGFEAHAEELAAYQQARELATEQAYQDMLVLRRTKLRLTWGTQIPDAALDYLYRLEFRLTQLEDKISLLKEEALYVE